MSGDGDTPPMAPDAFAHGRPVVTVELVIATVFDARLRVLLHRRTEPPFQRTWALPVGVIDVHTGWQGEPIEETVRRTLVAHTGLAADAFRIEPLATFGRVGRDPRTRVIAIAWLAVLPPDRARAIDDRAGSWSAIADDVPWMRLAFDHAEIIATGETRLQDAVRGGSTALALVTEPFTVADLRTVYDAVLGRRHDARNFRRRFQRMIDEGWVVQAPGTRHQGKSRPAHLWRAAKPRPDA